MKSSRSRTVVFLSGALAVIGAVFIVLGSQSPLTTVGILLVLILLVICMLRPSTSGVVALFLAITATPAVFPTDFALGGQSFHAYEPFLWVAAIGSIASLRRRGGFRAAAPSYIWIATFLLLASMLLGIVVGLARGNGLIQAVADHRQAIDMFAVVPVAARVLYLRETRGPLRTVKVSLIISMVLVVFSSLTGLPLNGRSEAAQLYSTLGGVLGADSSAVRLLSAATFPATGTLCVCLGLLVLGAVKFRQISTFAIPALVIVFLGFSRNNLLAVAVTFAVSIIFAVIVGKVRVAFKRTAVAGCAVLIVAMLAPLFSVGGAPSWLTVQFTAYSSRVLDGLSTESQSVDSSTQDREVEDEFMIDAIVANPVIGTGAGYAYKPANAGLGEFAATGGQYYGHNYYLWTLMKSGWLGFAALLAFLLLPVAAAISSRNATYRTVQLGFASALLGFAAIMIVAPLPNGSPTQIVLAILAIGAAVSPSPNHARQPSTELESRHARAF